MIDLEQFSSPSEKRIAVRVQPAAERAIRQGHPWLFADSITSLSHNGRSGDIAVVFDRKGRFLAVGLYDADAPIRVRLLHQGSPAQIDQAWFAQQLARAAGRRQPLLAQETNGYRLVHGENDGFSGLVIDRYAETYVLKLYSTAWLPHLRPLLAALMGVMTPQRVVLRLSRGMQAATEAVADGQILLGTPLTEPIVFSENGLLFEVDVIHGQKTGFFLDQRENRSRVQSLAAGRVLNVFAYTGGFSLYAARGGATAVSSVDLSEPALLAAQRNFGLNGQNTAVAHAQHETIIGDAFAVLDRLAAHKRRFDMVIIDPPSFAQRQAQVARAQAAYRRLVVQGLQVLAPGGTLVMASCSSRVAAADFFELVHASARQAGRPLREIERTQHALDHPITFAEGAYLKCLFARA